MHYAGPTSTPKLQGRCSPLPPPAAATGTVVYQTGYGNTPGMPYEEYAQLGTDVALAW
jgi:hypothetical protein